MVIETRRPEDWDKYGKGKPMPTIRMASATEEQLRIFPNWKPGKRLSEGQRRYLNMIQNGHVDICYLCGIDLTDENRTIDHRIPYARGGRGFDNLALCCLMCNWEKNNLTETEFRSLNT